jgi:hypothetical protein
LTLVLLAAGFSPAHAQPLAPLPPAGGPPLASTPIVPKRNAERPPSPVPSVLGAPVGVGDAVPVTPAGFVDAPADRKPQRAAVLGVPTAAGSGNAFAPMGAAPVPSEVVDSAVSRTAYQPANSDPVGEFLNRRSELKDREPAKGAAGLPKPHSAWQLGDWGEKLNGMVGNNNGGWFRSDHLFDGFISPVSNPFLFEDPRSLTELRPLFIYQKVPSSQPDFNGGHITFFGTQGRVAFTDRWSLVFHKFGGIAVNPDDASRFEDKTGFAEIWLGPKWTFYRGEENCTLAAAGLQFQLPVGSKDAFQDTGTLSIVPYVSYAQNFLRDFSLGSMNLMASTGYSFSVNNERSDYYWLSGHLDFDILNRHRFYPLMELNWFLVTAKGNSRPIGIEGRDLINFGGQASGSGLLTGAFGGRVKISENAQAGAAFEFPFAGRKDLFRYRFTLDFILRY